MEGSFRFIHCADLHLGCGFEGVSDSDEALGKRLGESTFSALDNIVNEAVSQEVDFVVFSGDIFHSTAETPMTRSRFVEAVKKIGVPCYIAYGNHDYMRRWESSIPLPDNAYVFPDTIGEFVYEKDGAQLARLIGASFSTKHTSKDLTEKADGYGDMFTIGVFHCNLDTISKDDKYAPCRLESLLKKDIDYWALGHIHKRTVVNENPYVVYSGNTQGRNPKESGEKGAYIVNVRNGAVEYLRFFRTGDILWDDVSVDITGLTTVNEIVDDINSKIENGSLISLTITGFGMLDKMVRLDPKGLTDVIQAGTNCKVVGMNVKSKPEIDIKAREDTGDFTSAVINYGKRLASMSRQELIEKICFTQTSQAISNKFDSLSDKELRYIVRDAVFMIIEKTMEDQK